MANVALVALTIVMTVIMTSRPAAASCASGSTLSPSVVRSSADARGQALPISVRGAGSTLPFTGAPVSLGVALGSTLVVVGAALLTAARARRRARQGGVGIAVATAMMAIAFVIGLAPPASATPLDCGLDAEPQVVDTGPAPLLPEAPIAVLLPIGALITVGMVRWRGIGPLART